MATNVTPLGNLIEGREYYLLMSRWRAGSAATYVLMGIDWQSQKALHHVHFASAQTLADALAAVDAFESDDQRQAMLAALDSENSNYVLRGVVLAGDQLDALGLRPWV
jgi:hypothetical protein